MAWGCGHHVQSRGCRGLRQKHDCVEEGEVGDEGRRQWCMGNPSGLRFVEEARGGRHPHHPAELRLGHARQVGHVLVSNIAAQRNTRQHLELAQPLHAGEELVLYVADGPSLVDVVPESGAGGAGRGGGRTWIARFWIKSAGSAMRGDIVRPPGNTSAARS